MKRETGKHSVRNKAKDFTKVLKQLLEAEVFTSKRKRNHKSFKKFQMNSTRSVKCDDLKQWMNTQLQKLLTQ